MPGIRCSVGCCNNRSCIKKTGSSNVIYHRFPHDANRIELWKKMCRSPKDINPATSHICSIHFTEQDYVRDLKHELMNTPSKKRLKPDAVPSLYLESPHPVFTNTRSQKTKTKLIKINNNVRSKKIIENSEITTRKNMTDQLLLKPVPIQLLQIDKNVESDRTVPEIVVNKELDIFKNKYDDAVVEIRKLKEIILNKEKLLKEAEKHIINRDEMILQLKSLQISASSIDNKIRAKLANVFTQQQLDYILLDKKKINWKSEDITKALKLKHFGKTCYIYLRQSLNYPLPSFSTLHTWANKLNIPNQDSILRSRLPSAKINEELLKRKTLQKKATLKQKSILRTKLLQAKKNRDLLKKMKKQFLESSK